MGKAEGTGRGGGLGGQVGGWAWVVACEQLLLYIICYSGQSSSVILTVFKAIVIFKSLTLHIEFNL